MDFLCSNLVKTIFTYWIGTVFNLILQLANKKIWRQFLKLVFTLPFDRPVQYLNGKRFIISKARKLY